jgi:hypothetical protein
VFRDLKREGRCVISLVATAVVRALIVLPWREGLRISEALALTSRKALQLEHFSFGVN